MCFSLHKSLSDHNFFHERLLLYNRAFHLICRHLVFWLSVSDYDRYAAHFELLWFYHTNVAVSYYLDYFVCLHICHTIDSQSNGPGALCGNLHAPPACRAVHHRQNPLPHPHYSQSQLNSLYCHHLYIFPSSSLTFYTASGICSVEMVILYRWQGHLRVAVGQLYFLIMCIIIVFCYVQIMKVARAASVEKKKLTWKGLRTVILHAFQLLLCLIQLWCAFIEAAVLQIDFMLFINVRYFNYITFILAPRCLSPLIYGLRDDLFFQAIRYYALCGLYKKHPLCWGNLLDLVCVLYIYFKMLMTRYNWSFLLVHVRGK